MEAAKKILLKLFRFREQWVGTVSVETLRRVVALDGELPARFAQFLEDCGSMKKPGVLIVGDERVDFSQVLFETCLESGERSVTGYDKLERHLQKGHTHLGWEVADALRKEKGMTTIEWLFDTLGITSFEILEPAGNATLFSRVDGLWTARTLPLEFGRGKDMPTAVLPPLPDGGK